MAESATGLALLLVSLVLLGTWPALLDASVLRGSHARQLPNRKHDI